MLGIQISHSSEILETPCPTPPEMWSLCGTRGPDTGHEVFEPWCDVFLVPGHVGMGQA